MTQMTCPSKAFELNAHAFHCGSDLDQANRVKTDKVNGHRLICQTCHLWIICSDKHSSVLVCSKQCVTMCGLKHLRWLLRCWRSNDFVCILQDQQEMLTAQGNYNVLSV